MILLEARLREAQLGKSAGEEDVDRQARREDLLKKAAMLRSAVQELRLLLAPRVSPLAYGFVCARTA